MIYTHSEMRLLAGMEYPSFAFRHEEMAKLIISGALTTNRYNILNSIHQPVSYQKDIFPVYVQKSINILRYNLDKSNKNTGTSKLSAEKVREILNQHGRLTTPVEELPDEGDLYNAGLTSLATVSLMLALEEEFDVEFPDAMLSRKTFGSIESIADAIEELQS